MSDEKQTILDYAAEELAELVQLQAVEDAAAEEARRVEAKRREAEEALRLRKYELQAPDRRRFLATLALAGEKMPPPAKIPDGPPLADLEATVEGLAELEKEAVEHTAKARDAVRFKVIEVYRQGATRAAVDYAEAAARLEQLHAGIAAAQRMMDNLGQGAGKLVVGSDFFDLAIPTSSELPALKGKGWQASYHAWLGGGDPERCRNSAIMAFDKSRAEIMRLLGGRWPMARRS